MKITVYGAAALMAASLFAAVPVQAQGLRGNADHFSRGWGSGSAGGMQGTEGSYGHQQSQRDGYRTYQGADDQHRRGWQSDDSDRQSGSGHRLGDGGKVDGWGRDKSASRQGSRWGR